MMSEKVMDNGLKVTTVNMPGMESVSIGMWVNVGSRYEPEKISGMSHFLEHLLFKGTKQRSVNDIKQSIEGVGGQLNAFTSEEFTCYLVKVPKARTELAIDVLSDMVQNALLNKEDIDKERMVILEEIKMYKDVPSHYVQDLLSSLIWPDHPMGIPVSGLHESVSSISRGQMRDYRDIFYTSSNVGVVVCGDVRQDDVLRSINKFMKDIKKNDKLPAYKKVLPAGPGPRTNFYAKDTEQTHLAIGMQTIHRHSDKKYALGLLSVILGGNMSSRLFEEVREKRGLAYEIMSSAKCYHDTGDFVISAGVDNKKVAQSIELIMAELKKIKKDTIDTDELNRAKEFYKGQFLLTLEDTMHRMIWIGEKIMSGEPVNGQKEILLHIDEVTQEEIKALAGEIFDSKLVNLALIGPVKKNDESEIRELLKVS